MLSRLGNAAYGQPDRHSPRLDFGGAPTDALDAAVSDKAELPSQRFLPPELGRRLQGSHVVVQLQNRVPDLCPRRVAGAAVPRQAPCLSTCCGILRR